MPAKVGAWDTGGVIAIEMSGYVPTDWNRKFYRAGWKWMRGAYIKSYFRNKQNIALEVQAEAEKLAQEYNNRFNDAA